MLPRPVLALLQGRRREGPSHPFRIALTPLSSPPLALRSNDDDPKRAVLHAHKQTWQAHISLFLSLSLYLTLISLSGPSLPHASRFFSLSKSLSPHTHTPLSLSWIHIRMGTASVEKKQPFLCTKRCVARYSKFMLNACVVLTFLSVSLL